ncbi:homologous-pairing protein 2 homolog isoform X1 [Herpailurus yagouaroundi]|uniref:homologous-pairing protein 2 homolog isoform X1 n=1 Tax=Herpailurus yagouaroundi TaxID=1608482 RepID=UPI001AD78A21|nr:homologous-pairing protein 2 homolog isoform X1 [Puma yagouaroundi]
MSKGRAEAAAGAPGILLRYLQEQNRPYSAQDVFGNLQREHGLGKAAVVKALEQLAQQGKIKEKMYGKQKIYFADQDQFDMVSDADLQGLDTKIVALTAKVQSLQQSCRHMEAELKELTSALTTPEMQKEIQELKKECAGYRERLKNIKAATNHVTPEEKEQVYRERQKYCKEWRKRKRMDWKSYRATKALKPASDRRRLRLDFKERTPHEEANCSLSGNALKHLGAISQSHCWRCECQLTLKLALGN